jgi:hypothetical protein
LSIGRECTPSVKVQFKKKKDKDSLENAWTNWKILKMKARDYFQMEWAKVQSTDRPLLLIELSILQWVALIQLHKHSLTVRLEVLNKTKLFQKMLSQNILSLKL